MNEQNVIQVMEAFPMKYYVDVDGNFLGGWDSFPPDDSIEVSPSPEYADQKWLFPGWGPSIFKLTDAENQWREEQMARVANQLLMIEDEDPNAEPGTARQWRDYRIALRSWTLDSPNFPDQLRRPVAPT